MSEIYDELDGFSGNDNFKGKNDINEVSDITSDLISTILSGKYNYTDLTGRFKAGENREDVPESIDTLKIALAKSPQAIREKIIDMVSKTSPLTRGQEGEIYKIKLNGGKEYVVAKKRFDIESNYEFNMHKLAYSIFGKSGSGVMVPEIFDEFNDGSNGYLLMEYIEGKTLDNLIWEGICKQYLIPKIEKLKKQGSKFYHRLDLDLSEFEKSYGSFDKFEFKTDNDVESGVFHLLEILYELGDFDIPHPPKIAEIDINNPTKANYPLKNNILEKYIGKTVIFPELQGKKIHSQLSIFLNELHSNGFYHRDIGGNYRNIIFSLDDNGEHIPYLIDFGVSINGKGLDHETIYKNPLELRNYYNDNSILDVIKNITGELTEKETVDINKLTTIKGAFMACIKGKNKLPGYFKLNTKTGKVPKGASEPRAKLEKLTNNLNEEEKILLLSFFEEKLEKTSNNKDITYKYAEVFLTYIGFDIEDYF